MKKKMSLKLILSQRVKNRTKLLQFLLQRRHKRFMAMMQARTESYTKYSIMLMKLYPACGRLLALKERRIRRYKSRPRSNGYWELLFSNKNEGLFFENFRMQKKSFLELCELLAVHLPCQQEFLTVPVPVEKQVAICLYKLASCAEYRVVGDVFGVHKSTMHKYFHLVVKAILKLTKTYIQFPKVEECLEIASAFEKVSNIPNVIGAIDGTHIPLKAPSKGCMDYVNRKGWTSMVMQAVVDNKYMFRDVSMKFPGSVHDSTVFKESGLFKNHDNIVPRFYKQLDNTEVPLMILGDPAYPLLPWLLKPYTGRLTKEEESFNCYLSSARIVVENAFGRLKGRWRCLSKKIDILPDFVPYVALACTVLHNYVEMKREKFIWTDESTGHLQQPTNFINNQVIDSGECDALLLRNHIKDYLNTNFELRQSHNH